LNKDKQVKRAKTFECEWRIECITEKQLKADRLCTKAVELLGIAPLSTRFEYDVDIPGYAARVITRHRANNWNDAFVECLATIQRLSKELHLDGDVHKNLTVTGRVARVSGVGIVEMTLSRRVV
jgi:hypothetical protein